VESCVWIQVSAKRPPSASCAGVSVCWPGCNRSAASIGDVSSCWFLRLRSPPPDYTPLSQVAAPSGPSGGPGGPSALHRADGFRRRYPLAHDPPPPNGDECQSASCASGRPERPPEVEGEGVIERFQQRARRQPMHVPGVLATSDHAARPLDQ